MYGFKNTKCKIDDCNYPIWPSKTLGYCNRHYQRHKRGRMDERGNLLPLPKRTKECEACGSVFVLGDKENHTRWCKTCRPQEYARKQTENNHGIYSRGQKNEVTNKQRYIKKCLNKIIRTLDRQKQKADKHKPLITARQAGKTYREIGKEFNISYQRAQQICAEYSQ